MPKTYRRVYANYGNVSIGVDHPPLETLVTKHNSEEHDVEEIGVSLKKALLAVTGLSALSNTGATGTEYLKNEVADSPSSLLNVPIYNASNSNAFAEKEATETFSWLNPFTWYDTSDENNESHAKTTPTDNSVPDILDYSQIVSDFRTFKKTN